MSVSFRLDMAKSNPSTWFNSAQGEKDFLSSLVPDIVKSAMRTRKKVRKVFLLDTSVVLHDHDAIYSFGDNDVAIPITVLEELDNFKRGNEMKNLEAREFIRTIDKLSGDYTLEEWIPLGKKRKGRFKIIMSHPEPMVDAQHVFQSLKADHRILNAAISLQEQDKTKRVILVSKDINLRLKAKALKLPAEDYETGKIKNTSNLYTGKTVIEDAPPAVLNALFSDGFVDDCRFLGKNITDNHYYILRNHQSSSLAVYHPARDRIERVEKHTTYGITPRNAEQAFAMHAILNPDVKLVTIQGVAGTGKTLLALAGAIEQRREFKQIILARPIVPLSNKEIGFLPGDVKDKIGPYMEPLWDNLKFIKNQFKETDKSYKLIEEMQKQEKIMITPLAYIRGRSFANMIFIIDEAQNLTPHEVKTIITRAGENTKIIFTGDIRQIDTPYLDEESNGLSYLIERLRGNALFAHITLEKGERSALANIANDLL